MTNTKEDEKHLLTNSNIFLPFKTQALICDEEHTSEYQNTSCVPEACETASGSSALIV
jgi:primosomal protein N'